MLKNLQPICVSGESSQNIKQRCKQISRCVFYALHLFIELNWCG